MEIPEMENYIGAAPSTQCAFVESNMVLANDDFLRFGSTGCFTPLATYRIKTSQLLVSLWHF